MSTTVAFSGSDGRYDVAAAIRCDCSAVGQEFAQVVEQDQAVAQKAPPLLRVEGDGPGGFAARVVRWRARGLVLTHSAPPKCGLRRVQLAAATTTDFEIWAPPVQTLCPTETHRSRQILQAATVNRSRCLGRSTVRT